MNALDKFDPRELGRRLKIARTAVRATQEQAARQTDLARTTLVAIEQGERRISAEELIGLCRLYKVEPGRLLQPETIHADLAIQFRSASAHDDAETLATLPLLQSLASRYVELEKLLGRPLEPAYPAIFHLQNGNIDEQAEDLAAELRSHLGIGNTPIPDVLALIESELKIRLLVVPLNSNISGAYAYHPALDACILINANHAKTRQNWTAAHELGHFMTDRQTVEIMGDESNAHPRAERFANSFAGAFLMPASAVRKRYRQACEHEGKFSARSLVYLSGVFYVSPPAMSLRLEKLGLFSKGAYEALKQRGLFQSLKRSVLGASDSPTEKPAFLPRYTLIALDAYEQELISEAELAKMLQIGRIETRELIDSLENFAELGVQPELASA